MSEPRNCACQWKWDESDQQIKVIIPCQSHAELSRQLAADLIRNLVRAAEPFIRIIEERANYNYGEVTKDDIRRLKNAVLSAYCKTDLPIPPDQLKMDGVFENDAFEAESALLIANSEIQLLQTYIEEAIASIEKGMVEGAKLHLQEALAD